MGDFALRGEFLSQGWERNQWPRPPSLAPSGQFTLRIAGGRVPVEFCRISGMQNLSGTLNSRRATGPWVCKNCRWCGSTSAPGFAEQVIVGLLSAGRPVSSPYEKEGSASRSAVGAGVLTRPPDFRQGSYKAVGATLAVAHREEIAPTCRGGTLGRPPSPGDSLVTFASLRKSLAAGAAKSPCNNRKSSIIAPSSVWPSASHLPPRGTA